MVREGNPMNFLFPYMARWRAINWSRYQQIFTQLAKMGHDVYVLQPPSSTIGETNFQEISIDIPGHLHLFDLNVNPVIWNMQYPLNKLVKKGYYSVRSVKKVNEMIREFNIDVLFLYNIPQYPLMTNKRCITVFDFADDYIAMLKTELGRLSNPLVLGMATRILNKMFMKSDLILSVSSVLADTIQHMQAKVKVLPNGVESESLNSIAAIPGNIAALKKPVIGFIGSFEYFIDFDLILAIAARLPDYTFLLVGSGRDLKSVREKAEKNNLRNVVFTGGVPHAEISSYIRLMDVCLNIFKKIDVSHAACPIKLFEYLMMKKPVVSNRLEEVERIDKNFLFYADTADEFAAAINGILADKVRVSEYVRRGYEITVGEYTWEKIAQRFLDLVNEAGSAHKGLTGK
jgi:glycosyltransferase involved in cell wall biosynthesis